MAKQFVTFCNVDEIAPGQREVFDLDRLSVLVLNVEGQFFAVENMCSHEEYELAEGEVMGCCTLECPKHGATFDMRSGEALTAPAYQPIQVFRTRVVDGELQVELDI
ncbi:MAG: non-heme iron oxygenase ferredoxin subunit [Anaerolineae bacterium]|nr:non-heme iron oxygenase ferredoxin subunit [Anaerolineae bacterium]